MYLIPSAIEPQSRLREPAEQMLPENHRLVTRRFRCAVKYSLTAYEPLPAKATTRRNFFMQIASGVRGDRAHTATASVRSMRASRPLRVSRLVAVGILLIIEILVVPIMGIAAHEMLASHQLPSEAWPIGTGAIHAMTIVLGTIGFAVAVRLCGGYKYHVADDLSVSLARMLTGGSIASLSLAALIYATSGNLWSHWSWFWTWLATASAALIGIRMAHYVVVDRLTKVGAFTRNVVIFGVSELGQ